MNKKQKPSQKKKAATVAAVLCFVAAIAIVGTYTFNDYKTTQQKEQLARAEETNDTEDEKDTEPAEEANNLVVSNQDDTKEQEDQNQEDTADTGGTSGNGSAVQSTSGTGTNVSFNEDSTLLWPVDGTILMSYSMDKTVYFSTLDQYKYNPAVIISGAEGD